MNTEKTPIQENENARAIEQREPIQDESKQNLIDLDDLTLQNKDKQTGIETTSRPLPPRKE